MQALACQFVRCSYDREPQMEYGDVRLKVVVPGLRCWQITHVKLSSKRYLPPHHFKTVSIPLETLMTVPTSDDWRSALTLQGKFELVSTLRRYDEVTVDVGQMVSHSVAVLKPFDLFARVTWTSSK